MLDREDSEENLNKYTTFQDSENCKLEWNEDYETSTEGASQGNASGGMSQCWWQASEQPILSEVTKSTSYCGDSNTLHSPSLESILVTVEK